MAESITATETLRVFHFDDKREVVSQERAVELVQTFRATSDEKSFDKISLSNKSYTEPASKVLADELQSLSDISIADVADIIAGRPEEEALEVLKNICSALATQILVEVDLSDNALGVKGVNACLGVIQDQQELQRVFFCNNGMSAEAAALIADLLLFRGEDQPTKLRTFHFYNNMSGSGGGTQIARIIRLSPHLENLRFSATRCGREGCAEIVKALSHIQGLKKLDLSDNTFGEEAGKELGRVISQQKDLEYLNLRDATLGDQGVKDFVDSLLSESKGLPNLKFLDLSSNELSADAVSAISKILKAHPKMETFEFEENELEAPGGKRLARVLGKVLPNLVSLNLSTNEITTGTALKLVEAVKGKKTLRSLKINGNAVSAAGLEKINQTLADSGMEAILGEMDDNDEDAEDEGESDSTGSEWEDEDEAEEAKIDEEEGRTRTDDEQHDEKAKDTDVKNQGEEEEEHALTEEELTMKITENLADSLAATLSLKDHHQGDDCEEKPKTVE